MGTLLENDSCTKHATGRCPSFCIGHGLGAHVCGIAGLSRKWLAELNDPNHNPAILYRNGFNNVTIDEVGNPTCPDDDNDKGINAQEK